VLRQAGAVGGLGGDWALAPKAEMLEAESDKAFLNFEKIGLKGVRA
jgi:hypothetical protein